MISQTSLPVSVTQVNTTVSPGHSISADDVSVTVWINLMIMTHSTVWTNWTLNNLNTCSVWWTTADEENSEQTQHRRHWNVAIIQCMMNYWFCEQLDDDDQLLFSDSQSLASIHACIPCLYISASHNWCIIQQWCFHNKPLTEWPTLQQWVFCQPI